MYNRIDQILEQYPFVVNQTYKGREAFICHTSQGLKIIKEYKGSRARADFLYEVLQFLKEHGHKFVDVVVKTKEGASVAVDADETAYMVRDWKEGRECDVKNREDIIKAVEKLADLHNSLRQYQGEIPELLKTNPQALMLEYQKHQREIKKVRNYIGNKKKKNDFEMEFLKNCNYFVAQADAVIQLQEKEFRMEQEQGERNLYGICHGDFNQHNVIFTKEGAVVLNYEKALYSVQAGDLSNFMRKILEKHNWNLGLGMDMLDAYQKIRPLQQEEMKQLYIRLAFPEKFWKIANHYYNSNKVWVCGRNLEKLNKLVRQNETKDRFLQIISHNLLF